ncbi:hypothetical protein [Borreliella turdi]|uniref:BB0158 famile outer surface lipoprotein n=1 Tax=Borreliella turdi TaxID=57863 RepID=UPI0030132916
MKNIETEISRFGPIKENNKKDIKENNNNISYINKESILTEIKEEEAYGGLFAGYITWAKSDNLRAIKDKYNNSIKNLKELKYSYIFSPIRFKTSSWFIAITILIILIIITIKYWGVKCR